MAKQQKKPVAAAPPVAKLSPPPPYWLAPLVLALVAFALYANTLGSDYTVDDGTVISNNTITKKGVSAIPEIFTTAYRKGFWNREEGLYRPLSVAMFAVEYQLAPENPFPGHLVNVILYMLTAVLLYLTLANVFRDKSPLLPFLASMLFIIHPLHTEVVANIKSRDEILCFLFCIASLFYFQNYLTQEKMTALILSAVCFFIAFFAKENAITFLPVFPLIAWFGGKTGVGNYVKYVMPFVVCTVVYLVIRYAVLGSLTGKAELQLINNSILGATSFGDRLASAIYVMGKYLYLLVIPYPLSFDYSYNQIPVKSFSDPVVLITTALLAYLVYYAFQCFRRKETAGLGILIFFSTISLVSNFLFLIESTMAERFLYMPSIGFCITITVLLVRFFDRKNTSWLDALKSKPAVSMLLGIVFLLYAGRTIARNSDWKDNLTLLAKDVQTCPESARIRYAYGSALLIEKALKEKDPATKEGYLDKSIVQLEKGVSILPTYGEAWYHLGIAYKEKNNAGAAIAAFEKAEEHKNFTEVDFFVAKGLAYGMGKVYDKAIASMSRAIEIKPDNEEAWNNKGLYFTELNVADSALYCLNKAIELKPAFHEAWYNKGNALAKTGDFKGAIDCYNKALEIKSDYIDAILNLGNCYAALKDYPNALKYFKEVEKTDPGNSKVLFNLGVTYNIMGDTANGNRYMRMAQPAR